LGGCNGRLENDDLSLQVPVSYAVDRHTCLQSSNGTNAKIERIKKKPGIGFAEAALVFADPLARIFQDEDHSIHEHREIMIGNSQANRLLVISFIESATDVVRIISEGDQKRATGL
jgi:uncharacterized protein